ncbi:hypothetical protein ODZ84_00120 [Chryseobacterium fluminis]|uniref:hypothetical protein n=1 Tax=Chryseobacterium fluminis TaxID=2983606 RepID=UPI00224F560E|nr:hypothetical protein [Chryseobacterium sp. MMS21-Ot14]UZT98012.1 hypothetical protein ODZ84_00120 [Chryseobacterium sp. MMS21-Ot14]
MKELTFKQLVVAETPFVTKFGKQKSLQFQKSRRFSYFENQLHTVFQYLQNHIATATMIAEATGIPQKNICRYKRQLEKAGRLWEVEKKKCKKTGFEAWYITTNPMYLPNCKKLNLF